MPLSAARTKPAPTVGVLLAGGQSRRMGEDKRLLALGDRPLALWPARTLEAVCTPCVQVGGAPVPGLDWPVLEDLRPGQGPAAGLETALLAFPGAAVVLCAVDVPFVSAGLLQVAIEHLPGHAAAVPRHAGRWHALAAAYSPALLPALTAWLDEGRRDMQGLLDRAPTYAIDGEELRATGDPQEQLANVNSRADLEAARERVRRRTS